MIKLLKVSHHFRGQIALRSEVLFLICIIQMAHFTEVGNLDSHNLTAKVNFDQNVLRLYVPVYIAMRVDVLNSTSYLQENVTHLYFCKFLLLLVYKFA